MSDLSGEPGRWLASGHRWYPPNEQCGDVLPPPSLRPPPVPPSSPAPVAEPPVRRRHFLLWTIGTVEVIVIGLVLTLVLANSGHNTPAPVTNALPGGKTTGENVSAIGSTYASYTSQFNQASTTGYSAISSAASDIASQDGRIQSDATTYSTNEFGTGCASETGSLNSYDSCLSQEQRTAANALIDEDTADAVEKTDISEEVTADGAFQIAITTYGQQLGNIEWPEPLQNIAANLEQDLSNERDGLSETTTAVDEGQGIAADKQALVEIASEVTTQQLNMATALRLPPPSRPSFS